ncbi:hypothetical protein Acr_28g0014820 [Actinidia rufa]|uniref:Transmembrane protein n=1 Tax=Actinidia rufa TaxID=165716 RepID=A0A7J0HCC1_9ERIC|nr:hypothetical protein Acr_28g0014820 [Actinidia rufa]
MARYHNSSYYDYLQYFSLPTHLCFFLGVVFLILCLTWYINYESMFEDFMDQLKLFLILSPIFLLLLVHWLSSADRQRVPFVISLPERESLHRAGGSPWGVAALLVFLLCMISYQSKLHESWFPLLSR